jgi:formylglycine-generating enzyme required for sulfatase activity
LSKYLTHAKSDTNNESEEPMIDESQLDNLKERLESIERKLEDNILKDANFALKYALDDPEGAASKAGRAIEGILGIVYKELAKEKGEKFSETKPMAMESLKDEIKKLGGKIPNNISTNIELIQRYRNVGSHANYNLTIKKDDLEPILILLLNVIKWYLEDIRKEELDFSNVGLKSREKQYSDIIKSAILASDGVITSNARKHLDAKVQELGIPLEKAKLIEEELLLKLGKPASTPEVQSPPPQSEDTTLNRREARVLEDCQEIIFHENKPTDALRELEPLIQKYPKNKEVSEAYAICLKEKDRDSVLQYLKGISKKSLLEYRIFVEVLGETGDFNSAFDELEEMGKLFPGESDVLQILEAHLNILEYKTTNRNKLLQTAEKLTKDGSAISGYSGFVNALVKMGLGTMTESTVPQGLELYYKERLVDEKAKREQEEKLAREKAEKEKQEREAREAKERVEKEERDRKERAERDALIIKIYYLLKMRVRQLEDEAREKEKPKTYTNSLGMEFVLIPAGEFMMGAVPQDKEAGDSEKPQHKVRITEPFYMGKYPVTQGEWEKLMGNNPSEFQKAGKKAPVETVNWKDCQEFIKKLGKKEGKTYRLPTEAEWEYAARGGSTSSPTGSYVYTYGDDAGKLGDYAWYDDNSSSTTHPVGQKKPNSIGLYDMMGNVWEWCEDLYDEDYYKNSPSADPKGADKGGRRSLRGGSWRNYARFCRLSVRYDYDPGYRLSRSGFRLILFP